MRLQITVALCVSLAASGAMAQLGRHGGGTRANVQNRSANYNRGGNYNANANRNYNANVNRNVNVNQNINVNRNVDVHTNYYGGGGCWNCGYYHDNDWNWGSFAAGAAVGVATTAVVASAAHSSSSTTVVVAPPAVGTMVTVLPGGCASINTGGGVLYNCSNVYYRPYYQGTSLVYQVVTYP